MPASSFVARGLRATFVLAGSGQIFPGTNNNTLRVSTLRMSAQVRATARLASQMSLRVQGMKKSDMDAITVTWANPPVVLDHYVTLEANNGDGWAKVFSGTIIEAQPDYSGAPDTALQIQASVGYFQKINGTDATSYTETVDIDLIVSDIVSKLGPQWKFVNGGVTAILAGPVYLHGTLVDQLDDACQQANCDYYLQNDTVTITPRGKPIAGAAVAVLLNKNTGMIGYPSYERSGLQVRALYQPVFDTGVPIQVESSVFNASGRWYPYTMVHALDGNTPQGKWETNMQCLRVIV